MSRGGTASIPQPDAVGVAGSQAAPVRRQRQDDLDLSSLLSAEIHELQQPPQTDKKGARKYHFTNMTSALEKSRDRDSDRLRPEDKAVGVILRCSFSFFEVAAYLYRGFNLISQ